TNPPATSNAQSIARGVAGDDLALVAVVKKRAQHGHELLRRAGFNVVGDGEHIGSSDGSGRPFPYPVDSTASGRCELQSRIVDALDVGADDRVHLHAIPRAPALTESFALVPCAHRES